MTAEELFGTVDRDTRNKAKTINFAILYGISSWGLAGRLGVPKEEGKAIIARYFERFPGIRDYIDETLAFVRENGFTRTLFGRKTHFPNIRRRQPQSSAPAPSGRRSTRRSRAPAPTSSSGRWSGWTRRWSEAGLEGVRMLLQVHDELVFEVPDGREEEAATVVREVMANAAEPAMTLDVPLDVEVGWGAHWGAAH